MRIIQATPDMKLPLGRLGENEYVRIDFDVSDWLEEYPDATIGLVNVLPKETEGYPAVISTPADGIVSWTITSAELTVEGQGKCQLQATSGETVVKGKIWTTIVFPALDDSADVPDPWESWETEFTRLKGLAEDAAEAAEAWATGGTSGTPGATNNAKYYSEQAEAAQTAAETAQGLAEDAQEAAETAQGAAEDAQEAAETAQGLAEDAQTAAETAQGAAEDSAEDAEAWAVGQRGGVDVGSSDATYHNNSKYYANVAETAAQSASAAYGTNLLAPTYSASSTYAVGDHVIYNGGYYECKTAIATAEAWTAAHWTQLTVGGEASSLKNQINAVRKVYDTVADMLDDESLTAGTNVETRGYYVVGDNGNNEYTISATHTGVFYLTLDNGLYANLITEEGLLRCESIGMKAYAAETNDPDEDDMDRNVELFNTAIYNGIYLLIGKGWFYFSDKVLLARQGTYTIRGISRERSCLVFPNSDGLYFSDPRYYNYYVIRGLYIKSYGHCIRCSEECLTVLDSHFEWLYLISENGDGFHGPDYNIAKYVSQGGDRTVYDTCVQNAVFDFINVQAHNGAGIANVMGMYSTYKHFNFVSCKYAFRNCDGTLEQANTLSNTPGVYEDYFIYFDKTYSHSLKWKFINVNAEGIGKAFIYTEPRVEVPAGEDPKKPETANIMTLSSITAIDSGWSLQGSVENHDVYPITVQALHNINLMNAMYIISPSAYPSKYDTSVVKGEIKLLSTSSTPGFYDGGKDIKVTNQIGIVFTLHGKKERTALNNNTYFHGEDGTDIPYSHSLISADKLYGGKATQIWNTKVSEIGATSNINPPDEYKFADAVLIENDTNNVKMISTLFNTGLAYPGRIITVINSPSSLNNIGLNDALHAGIGTGGFALRAALTLQPKDSITLITTYYTYNNTRYVAWMPFELTSTEEMVISVTGATPTINGEKDKKYFCGTLTSLTINPPNSGTIEVYFTSGSTPTTVTIPRSVKVPSGFDPNNLDANTKYMIRITNATYGEVESFVDQPLVNILDYTTFVDDKVWWNGNMVAGYNNHCATPKVEITPGKTYLLQRDPSGQGYVSWFDENENFVSQESWTTNTTKTIATGVHYVGISIAKTDKENALLAEY